jgi:signal transduction histidine kinase
MAPRRKRAGDRLNGDRGGADVEGVLLLEREIATRDEFIATIGHELRSPLSPIYMQVQALLKTMTSTKAETVSVDWVVPQIERLSRRLDGFREVLNRVLDVAHMSTGRVQLFLEDVDLAEVARDAVSSVERELSASGSALTWGIAAPVIGQWDRIRLEQIVINLVSNAIRYGAGQPIVLDAWQDDGTAHFSVRDHGIGIAPENQRRIFERFERLDGSHAPNGLGIGLWIARRLAIALGGDIQVRSILGQGSSFTLRLPVRRIPAY